MTVYPKIRPTKVAAHRTESYQVQDPDGKVITLYEPHPHGSRKLRRARQQHHPSFTKKMTRGSLWNPRNNESQAM